MQGRGAGFIADVDPRAVRQQEPSDFRFAFEACVVERRGTLRSNLIRFGAGIEQDANNIRLSVKNGLVERGRRREVLTGPLWACLEQYLNHFRLPVVQSFFERR